MSYVVMLDDAVATKLEVAGGKGANLARLVRAGFTLPSGFVATTEAYRAHIDENKLESVIAGFMKKIQFSKPEKLEAATAEIRAAITGSPIPRAVSDQVLRSYRELGKRRFVAVRSSGTAEDLADASFAGQHDTYLDVIGDDEVLTALRRCWASLFTARATAYRHERGYDHSQHSLAVVILDMIESVSSGVLFTANPVTRAVDEYVINSTWGLGEGIVSGRVTPDSFVLDRGTLQVKKQALGAKELRVIRNARTRQGTIEDPVPPADRARYSLTDEQASELGLLGRRVAEYFGDWPQDIEWAWADGRFYLLQSRDITGVEFCWDEDIDEHGDLPREADDAILSRARADAVWSGRITPLFYSLRSEARTLAVPRIFAIWAGTADAQRKWGGGGREIGQVRWYKYYRGAVYFSSEFQFRTHLESIPPAARRPALCDWVPPSWLVDFNTRPGSWFNILKILIRIGLHDPDQLPHRVFKSLQKRVENGEWALGLKPSEIRLLSDTELKRYVQKTIRAKGEWDFVIANTFNLYAPYLSSVLEWMLETWYSGPHKNAATRLITGLPAQTYTIKQNAGLWDLTQRIRNSKLLLKLFKQFNGTVFFGELPKHAEGRAFLDQYQIFLRDFGHRGQADRDGWYPRRSEDPAVDYRSFALLMQVDNHLQEDMEAKLIAERTALTEDVVASIRKQPLGLFKAEALKYVQDLLLRYYVWRDDSRHQTDRHTYAKKNAVLEVGRRLLERGLLTEPDEFYYLSKNELFQLLDGNVRSLRLMKAKAVARRRNCDRIRKEWFPPMYLRGDGTVFKDPSETSGGEAEIGRFSGIPMSGGTIVATARIVPSIEDLGKVQKGDILIARSTDPGWTPVFMVLSGVVLETGGALSHGSCLAREYAVPAVQLTDAMSLIKDGTKISVDGDTGEIRVLDEDSTPADAGRNRKSSSRGKAIARRQSRR